MSVLAIGAVAQPPVEPTEVSGQKAPLANRDSPLSKTEFRLSEHQQLKGYFFDGQFR
jgi:hypothetical protein